MTRKALGKGLSALLGERTSPPEVALPPQPLAATVSTAPLGSGLREIATNLVEPNPYQPRTSFDESGLAELAASIRSSGVVQPILVRPLAGRFQLIAGERRWRAARLVGFDRIPALVRDIPDEKMLETSLVENLQREDLNPIEQARAYQALMRQANLTQDQAAERTGKDRTTVANLLRLLRLPDFVQEAVLKGRLSGGHARALIALEDRPQLLRQVFERALNRGLSVRAVERLVQGLEQMSAKKPKSGLDPNIRAAVEHMQRVLGTRVQFFSLRGGRSRIVIECASLEELHRVYARITQGGG